MDNNLEYSDNLFCTLTNVQSVKKMQIEHLTLTEEVDLT